jgi:acetyl-CoA synthetase
MREGNEFVLSASRKSLRLLGTVGEPINPEAWNWYHDIVGNKKCPIVDTWWQTETGGILISETSESAAQRKQKPGSAAKPLFGIEPAVLTADGVEIEGAGEGVLVLKNSWPGQMRTVYKDHQRFEETYFSTFKGYYFTGDGCRRDNDGDYWITGRVDDVINVSGHRLGTAEIESAFVDHAAVAEAAVVGYPHTIKGQGIYAYVTLKRSVDPTDHLLKELREHVRKIIGPLATPDHIQWAQALPKTRSGKIMRRILRKIAENEIEHLGDISTLADPLAVKDLVENRKNK